MKIVRRLPWRVVYILLTVLALIMAIGAPEDLPH
jgi:hypothetical protein